MKEAILTGFIEDNFITPNSYAQIFFMANIGRLANDEDFEYQTRGLQSDVLDISIQFYNLDEGFRKKLIFVFKDDSLCSEFLKRLAESERPPAEGFLPDQVGNLSLNFKSSKLKF